MVAHSFNLSSQGRGRYVSEFKAILFYIARNRPHKVRWGDSISKERKKGREGGKEKVKQTMSSSNNFKICPISDYI